MAIFYAHFLRNGGICLEVKINREIRDYTESMFFGLSMRQFFFSVAACGVAVVLYFILKPYFGIETLSWMCILGAAPFAAMGFNNIKIISLMTFVNGNSLFVDTNRLFVGTGIYIIQYYGCYKLLVFFRKDDLASKFSSNLFHTDYSESVVLFIIFS